MKKLMMLLAVTGCLVASSATYAMNTISFYGGNNYVLGNKSAWSLEFLYFGGWKYGDNLYFFEVTNPHRDTTSIVGEWYSRLSYKKITGHQVKLGPISDVSLATELSVSGLNQRVYGVGPGFDWKLPLFSNLLSNVFWLHNSHEIGSTYQVVSIWTMPIHINDRLHLVFGGYGQYSGPLGRLKANLQLEPSLMLDLGHVLHLSSNKLFAGVQYAYWHNELGLNGVTESLPELKFTWAF